ncbi:MAG: LeuA family protein [bacterium]
MRDRDGWVVLKDATMREGLDVPGVALDPDRKRALLGKLAEAWVPEVELVAPGHFDRDLEFLKESGAAERSIRSSGLIYGNGPGWREQIGKAKGVLDRVDILMPLSDARPPAGRSEKSRRMKEALRVAVDVFGNAGVGFPHATQVEGRLLVEMCHDAVQAGAKRITLYDTNGSSDPWAVGELVARVRETTEIGICFHAHNDLGMATANSIAAVRAGATFLDVTVNGLGDRAGNASLEQVALVLHSMGVGHGLRLDRLRDLSRAVEAMTLVPVSKLAPIVGEFVFRHKSPGHLASPALFEAFDPALVGAVRSICEG